MKNNFPKNCRQIVGECSEYFRFCHLINYLLTGLLVPYRKKLSPRFLRKDLASSVRISKPRASMCMIKIFGGGGGDTFKPPTNNFCLCPPPVLRCFWKDPLMTPTPTTPLQASFTATPPPHPPPLPPPQKILIIHYFTVRPLHPVNK